MLLTFKRAEVLRLFNHAKSQTTWRKTYNQEGTDIPGVWIVGDQGIYLMSNGQPPLLANPDDPISTSSFIVHAEECNPEKDKEGWWETKREAFGGDDGVDLIPCEITAGIEKNSIRQWLEVTEGLEFVSMELTPDSMVLVDCDIALRPEKPGRVRALCGPVFRDLVRVGIAWKAWSVPVREMDRYGLVAYIGCLKQQAEARAKQDKRTLEAIEIYEKHIRDLEKRLKKYEPNKPKNEKTRRPAKGSTRKRKAA